MRHISKAELEYLLPNDIQILYSIQDKFEQADITYRLSDVQYKTIRRLIYAFSTTPKLRLEDFHRLKDITFWNAEALLKIENAKIIYSLILEIMADHRSESRRKTKYVSK